MANQDVGGHAVRVTPPSTTAPSCCGSPLQEIRLAGSSSDAGVDMVRCAVCGRTSWRRDGQEVARDEALAALSQAHPTGTVRRDPRPRPQRSAPARTVRPATRDDLTGLLSGWQVLGG
jgi:hypothetical protein